MKTVIPVSDIADQLIMQLSSHFLLSNQDKKLINSCMGEVISRLEKCFLSCLNRCYNRDGEAFFNPYHSAQYAIFLYYFSNSVHKTDNDTFLADKIYYSIK